ncbi:MAG: CHAD domain-containing protein [Vicinamibacterales bacterium]
MSAERLTGAMAEQVRRFAHALSRARRGDVTGVHQARVASRRIREILPLVETWELAGDDEPQRRRRRGKDVRRVAAALGAVRELDVTLGLLSAAAVRHGWQAAVVADIVGGVEADRTSRLADLIDALDRVGPRTFLRDLRKAAMGKAPPGSALEHAMNARRQSRASGLADNLRALGILYVPDRLHAVRLSAKKLRYSLETQRTVRRAAVARDLRTLATMQEQLGRLHDLQILQDRLRGAPGQAHRVELRSMNADTERECRAMHARIIVKVQAWLQMADRLTEG